MEIALIAPIESNGVNLNKQKNITPFTRLYEDEAIRCFTQWRRNAGWLKDIPIYVICPTKNVISPKTKEKFNDLGVKYYEKYEENSEKFSSGFINLPYSGVFFEENTDISEDFFIRIDLDMSILRPIPERLFEIATEKPVIGQYDINSIKDLRTSYPGILPFDTGFMITNKKYHFYKTWYDLCFSEKVTKSDEWMSIKSVLGEYYLEEFAVDWINYNKICEIYPILCYQYGEGYASIDDFTDELMKDIYFLHEHIYLDKKFPWGYDSVGEKIKYLKRMRAINDTL